MNGIKSSEVLHSDWGGHSDLGVSFKLEGSFRFRGSLRFNGVIHIYACFVVDVKCPSALVSKQYSLKQSFRINKFIKVMFMFLFCAMMTSQVLKSGMNYLSYEVNKERHVGNSCHF